ncbi:MAG: J domain-containing protein [Acidobacteria bacterium]|nr:J domain-containing protein [Acidobacteriota bacterium]
MSRSSGAALSFQRLARRANWRGGWRGVSKPLSPQADNRGYGSKWSRPTTHGERGLQKVHTHYANLKVARDAPPEVIRAAYRSLSQKYHPDRNPGDPNAARVMAIINASYEVLSDPVKRREHDEWLLRAESGPDVKAPPRHEAPASPRPSTPRPEPKFEVGAHFRRYWRYWFAYALSGFLLFAVSVFRDSPPSKRNPPSPGLPVVTPTEVAPVPAPPVVRPSYVRPALAPNGEPWPAVTGYIHGYQELHTDGLSSVRVDNSQNDSDVFAKLVEQERLAVRVFFIRAREQFTVANVRDGSYDIRYKDLDSGVISKSEAFDLKAILVGDRIQYSQMQLTLYKVRGGNIRMETISEEEF